MIVDENRQFVEQNEQFELLILLNLKWNKQEPICIDLDVLSRIFYFI